MTGNPKAALEIYANIIFLFHTFFLRSARLWYVYGARVSSLGHKVLWMLAPAAGASVTDS
jgi:hypothetical protein